MSWIPGNGHAKGGKRANEQWKEREYLEQFNSVTQSVKPQNQNQDHNVKEEGIKPKNQDR